MGAITACDGLGPFLRIARFLALAVFVAACGGGDSTPSPFRWSITYGPEMFKANSVRQAADGAHFAVGCRNRFEPRYGYENTAWIMKLDAAGNVNWSKTYESWNLKCFSSLEPTADGGYMVAGEGGGYGAIPGNLVVRIDASGNVIWAKSINGMYGGKVWPAAGDGYIVTGPAFKPVGNIPDSWIALKIDEGGRVIWQKTYTTEPYPFPLVDAVRTTVDGGYVVSGWASSSHFQDTFLPRTFVLKLDASGGIVWQRTYLDAATKNWGGYGDVRQTADGGYFLLSNSTSVNNSRSGARMLKLDSQGNIVWQRNYESDVGYAQFVGGFLSSADGGYVMAIAFGHDPALVVKLDARGNVVWQKSYGTEEHVLYSFEASADGGFVMGGLSMAGALWLLKNDADGAGAGCAGEGLQQMTAVDSHATAADGIFRLTSSSLTHASSTVVLTDIAMAAQEMCPVPSW